MQRMTSVRTRGKLSIVPALQPELKQSRAADLIGRLESLKEVVQEVALLVEVAEESKKVEINFRMGFYESVQRFETAMIQRALELTHGSQTKAAELLGIKVTTLNSKIKRYKIRCGK